MIMSGNGVGMKTVRLYENRKIVEYIINGGMGVASQGAENSTG